MNVSPEALLSPILPATSRRSLSSTIEGRMTTNPTIAVAMSGGVDSSTVAAMLRAEGHELVGLTMQLWNQRRLAGREGMPEQVKAAAAHSMTSMTPAAWPDARHPLLRRQP